LLQFTDAKLAQLRISDSKAEKEFAKHHASFKSEYYNIQNRTLHYVVTGKDSFPTLIFIHGSPGNWDVFKEYLLDSSLQQHYRMISVDRPGFGYSDFGKAMNLDDQSSLISEALEHIQNGKPICLVGYSFGGPLVIKLTAVNHNLPVTNVITLAGAFDPSQEKSENWLITLDRTPLRYFLPGATRASNAELLLFKHDVEELPGDLHKVTCKVLIMHGTKDDVVPVGNSIFAYKNLTNAKDVKVVLFEDANHYLVRKKFMNIRNALLQLNMSF